MRRREFIGIAGGAALWPLAALAQQKPIPVIGWLHSLSADRSASVIASFGDGLRETGYIEGRNVAIDYRWADGRYDRLPDLAADLVGCKVDVILTGAAPHRPSLPRRPPPSSRSSLLRSASQSSSALSRASPGQMVTPLASAPRQPS